MFTILSVLWTRDKKDEKKKPKFLLLGTFCGYGRTSYTLVGRRERLRASRASWAAAVVRERPRWRFSDENKKNGLSLRTNTADALYRRFTSSKTRYIIPIIVVYISWLPAWMSTLLILLSLILICFLKNQYHRFYETDNAQCSYYCKFVFHFWILTFWVFKNIF